MDDSNSANDNGRYKFRWSDPRFRFGIDDKYEAMIWTYEMLVDRYLEAHPTTRTSKATMLANPKAYFPGLKQTAYSEGWFGPGDWITQPFPWPIIEPTSKVERFKQWLNRLWSSLFPTS